MAFDSCQFPDPLKVANITPVFKKGDKTDKSNYRPVSILPLISKVFERKIFEQLSNYLETFFNSLLCGFRKKHGTQHALFNLLCKWKRQLDEKGFVASILMDLSKAYDCLPHDLIIAKLEAYGLSKASLKFLYNYFKNRFQRTKIGSDFSSFLEILLGVPQGSILGPLIFNLFINDLFYFIEKTVICNFADDNTLYSCGTDITSVFSNIEDDTSVVLNWFYNNCLKANPAKFQFIVLGKNFGKICLNINGSKIQSKKSVTLLGIEIDNRLNFLEHISAMTKKINLKTRSLARIRTFLSQKKAEILGSSFVMCLYFYCPLIWMFTSKKGYNMISRSHYRLLRVLYKNYDLTYPQILELHNLEDIHTTQLKFLMIEVYKSLNSLNPKFTWSLFETKELAISLRCGASLLLPPARTTFYGLNSLLFRGALTWNLLPNYLKQSPSLDMFKANIKLFKSIKCNCSLCR